MNLLRLWIGRLPSMTFSMITLLVILWLTLAPQPLGEEPPQLFPGADKMVHALMFGGLASMFLLDWQRKHGWKPVSIYNCVVSGSLSALTGIIIEFLQAGMGMGRSFEFADILADTFGAYFFSFIFMFLQKFWVPRP